MVATARSSPLADGKDGQAALFALSRGRKEGEVEEDVIPTAGGAVSRVCLGLVVLSRSLLACERMPFAGSGMNKD